MYFIVTTEADERSQSLSLSSETQDGDGLSLREALALASATAEADIIRFDPSVLSIDLDSIFLTIDSDVSINGDHNGDGQADVKVMVGWESLPVIRVTEGANVVLESLMLTGGGAGVLPDRSFAAAGRDGFDAFSEATDFEGASARAGNGSDGTDGGFREIGGGGGDGGTATVNGVNGDEGNEGFGGNGGDGGDGGIGVGGGRGGANGRVIDLLPNFGQGDDVYIAGNSGNGGDGGFGGGYGGDGGPIVSQSTDGNYRTFSGNIPRAGDGGDGGDAVGGIWNQGNLTLRRVEIFDTRAVGGDGGSAGISESSDGRRHGEYRDGRDGEGGDAVGGVYTDETGSLTLSDTAFSSTGLSQQQLGNAIFVGLSSPYGSLGITAEDGLPFGSVFGPTSATTPLVGNIGSIVSTEVASFYWDPVEEFSQSDSPIGAEFVESMVYVYSASQTAHREKSFTFHINRLGNTDAVVDVDWSVVGDIPFLQDQGSVKLDEGERSTSITLTVGIGLDLVRPDDVSELRIATDDVTLGTSTLIIGAEIPGLFEGSDLADSIALGAEDDAVYSYGGDDRIATRAGDDFVVAGDGDDVIGAGQGNDEIFGGDGDDLFYGGPGSDSFTGGAGVDTIDYSYARETDSLTVDLRQGETRGADSDILVSLENVITGAGNDNILGNQSDNVLDGGDGRDKLRGFDGDDVLIDGAGSGDNLFGGRGSDVFVLVADGSADSIKDFELGVDLIDVSAWGLIGLTDMAAREHRNGKLILSTADEVLALSSRSGPLSVSDLSDDWFLFQ